MQATTGKNVRIAFVDQGYTVESAAVAAKAEDITLVVIKRPTAKCSFVLLPRRWVAERSFVWAARFRRLARDYAHLSSSLSTYHWLAFVSLGLSSLFRQSA